MIRHAHSLFESLKREHCVVVLCCLFLLHPALNYGAAADFPKQSDKSKTNRTETAQCQAKEYRQLDFWIGDWDVADFDNPSVVNARVRVDSILDGCVLHEDYQDSGGAKGQSFSIYDATTHTWHQTWVTNRGRLLLLNGGLTGAGFVLTGEDRTPEGKKRIVRGIWKPLKNGVRETAVLSLDEGKTWQPWFDLLFQPHRQ